MGRWLGAWIWLVGLAGCSDVQIAKQEIDLDEDGYVAEIDCDGSVDVGAADVRTFWEDGDGDGWGDAGSPVTGCAEPDGDGWGDASAPYTGCAAPAGYVTSGGDCDDAASAVNPGATEVCDPRDVDEDCDGSADDADPSVSGQGTYWLDADLDGFGDVSVQTCDPAYNEITTGGDCDDTDPDSSPLGTEVCGDGIDQDCSGADESCGGAGCATARRSAPSTTTA